MLPGHSAPLVLPPILMKCSFSALDSLYTFFVHLDSGWPCTLWPFWGFLLFPNVSEVSRQSQQLLLCIGGVLFSLRKQSKHNTNSFSFHHSCGGLTLAGHQMPTKATLPVSSSAGQRRENRIKGLWIEIRTRRGHSPITVTGKTDST